MTIPLYCYRGQPLFFGQGDVIRYACLSPPLQAQGEPHAGRKWPLLIYLHGSLTTPESLYLSGRDLFALHDTFPLSGDPEVKGFYVLSPEGRRATPWPSNGPETGSGFHWDEWYRDPSRNLDALAIDRFLNQVIATGRIDTRRIYVFGWSNGAYMAALYGVWRGDRIAAIGQYAGADPWSRTPCPVSLQAPRKVPLVLLRNLCDALVPCATTSAWVTTLTQRSWPFAFHNLGLLGAVTRETRCTLRCSKPTGLYEHIRWPNTDALKEMLSFLRRHPLP
ncbi:MAG TPA: PHB depolymerase family esterase [Methylomirabilota bacterium]|nr:PHB depolymerase family esterase [Methylomirabilota bacterium]